VKGKHVTGFTNGEEAEMAAHERGSVPRRGWADAAGGSLKGPELAALFYRRWPSYYGPESCVIHLHGSGTAETRRQQAIAA